MSERQNNDKWRNKLRIIIFGHETHAGKWFDIILLIAILVSILIVMLETVNTINEKYKTVFHIVEWILTIFFTIEYILRLYISRHPMKYATSFFGIVDLLAIIPTYLSIFIAGSQQLMIIRGLRLLRAFRIFKLAGYMQQGKRITAALKASKAKIVIFLYFVIVLVIIIGCIMYLIEGGVNKQFTSIPRSVYWAIVTLTTVGYGDISPITNLGQFLAAIVMLMGYAIIAVPTGIVSSELMKEGKEESKMRNVNTCGDCRPKDHDPDAVFCKYCSSKITYVGSSKKD